QPVVTVEQAQLQVRRTGVDDEDTRRRHARAGGFEPRSSVSRVTSRSDHTWDEARTITARLPLCWAWRLASEQLLGIFDGGAGRVDVDLAACSKNVGAKPVSDAPCTAT